MYLYGQQFQDLLRFIGSDFPGEFVLIPSNDVSPTK